MYFFPVEFSTFSHIDPDTFFYLFVLRIVLLVPGEKYGITKTISLGKVTEPKELSDKFWLSGCVSY